MKYCKQCGAEMFEDASEEITFEMDSIILDGFSSWVCKKKCGYEEKIDNGGINHEEN